MSDEPRQTYYRASLGLKAEIADTVAADYHSELVEGMRARGGRLDLPGLTLHLAREFGFCYGVDKAVDMAYEARRKFPDKRIFLLTEIIHNPRVNQRLVDMGIHFLTGPFACGLTQAEITADDVVIIPAFGTAADQFKALKTLGAIVVDTTCGSVVHVWKRVEKYARDGFTSLVHGKYYHEETIATVSQAVARGGHFLVVRNPPQAQRVCDFIEGRLGGAELMAGFEPGAHSAGFDPEAHLQRIGVANQTTMLASESLGIARMVGEALGRRHGEGALGEHFRSFDTICSATQDRQDAMVRMIEEERLDLVLVIGGYNSSNTTHLLELALRTGCAYHIQDSAEIRSEREIRHLPLRATEPVVTADWLPGPADGATLRVGLTAGASTPNKAIADAVDRLLAFRGLAMEQALAALGA
jgi:4-hydroxy-3-methylbut-2-enyl diphosphate reductase